MAKDYRYRASQHKKKSQHPVVVWWKWLLIVGLLALFAFFLVFLNQLTPDATVKPNPEKNSNSQQAAKSKSAQQQPKAKKPRFDFYTILPETEVVVPDYELKTRSREAQLGKDKPTQYMIQAGAFTLFSTADKLRSELAFLGVESHTEKTKVKSGVIYRVKMGPFRRPADVYALQTKLKNNGIGVMVIEVKK